MTKAQCFTLALILVAATGLIVADIALVLDDHEGNTISAVMTTLAMKSSTVPVAMGVLMGHFFWPISSDRKAWQIVAPLLALLAATIAMDYFFGALGWFILPGKFLAGFIAGHFFWPNARKA